MLVPSTTPCWPSCIHLFFPACMQCYMQSRKMTVLLNYSARRKPRRWFRGILIPLAVVGVLYVGAFELMYIRRDPAANMLYFIYSEDDSADTFSYRFFFPIYWVQRHVFGGQKHNDDRAGMDPTAP